MSLVFPSRYVNFDFNQTCVISEVESFIIKSSGVKTYFLSRSLVFEVDGGIRSMSQYYVHNRMQYQLRNCFNHLLDDLDFNNNNLNIDKFATAVILFFRHCALNT